MSSIDDTSGKIINSSSNLFNHLQYEYLAAGVAGGVTATLALHPLDLLKIRFAVNDGHTKTIPQYYGIRNAITKIIKTEGIRGLYQGITPNVLGSGAAWGSYFLFYNSIKTWTQNRNKDEQLGPVLHLIAATNAGILTLILTNPIWVLKTRLCLQYAEDVNLSETKRYSGMIDAIRKIYATEGSKGFYKGFLPGLLGVSHGAIQFMTYEEMKVKYNIYRNKPINLKLDTSEYIICAALSKIIAAALTYPYQVIRARLQDVHHNYQGFLHCFESIYKLEGWRGFYKGLGVNIIRVTPATVITFVVYEKVSHYLFKDKKVSQSIEAFTTATNITKAQKDNCA